MATKRKAPAPQYLVELRHADGSLINTREFTTADEARRHCTTAVASTPHPNTHAKAFLVRPDGSREEVYRHAPEPA